MKFRLRMQSFMNIRHGVPECALVMLSNKVSFLNRNIEYVNNLVQYNFGIGNFFRLDIRYFIKNTVSVEH